jgi:hypothetical protein
MSHSRHFLAFLIIVRCDVRSCIRYKRVLWCCRKKLRLKMMPWFLLFLTASISSIEGCYMSGASLVAILPRA